MTPFLYAINIGTLATWLSVAGLGTIGIIVPTTLELFSKKESKDPYANLESIVLTEDFNLGDLPPSQETDTGTTGEANEAVVPLTGQETLPTPPDMPETAEITPLPEVPEIPPPAPRESVAPAPPKPRPIPTTNSTRQTSSSKPSSPAGGSLNGKEAAKGKVGNGGSNGGSGMSDAKRLAGGRMPAPTYPSEARAKGQSGTVIVEFVVGENGSVISAYATSPSPWPILNERAVSAVRRWKFPPGNITKYKRPIVFKLN